MRLPVQPLKTAGICPARFYERIVYIPFPGHAVKGLASPDSSMLFVDVPWAMSFRICLPVVFAAHGMPCGSSAPPYPAHTPVPAPSAWLFLRIWLSCAGKYLHQSVTLGQFVSSAITDPHGLFLHLTVAQEPSMISLINGHLLPDRELSGKRIPYALGNILQAVIHFHEMIAF